MFLKGVCLEFGGVVGIALCNASSMPIFCGIDGYNAWMSSVARVKSSVFGEAEIFYEGDDLG